MNDDSDIMATVSQHFDNRGQLRKQIRRKRIMLYYSNFECDVADEFINMVAENAAFDRMSAVERQLSFVGFDEDADDIRAQKKQDELEGYESDENSLEDEQDEKDEDEDDEAENNDTQDEEEDEEPLKKKLKLEELDDTSKR